IDELSKDTLMRYIPTAARRSQDLATRNAKISDAVDTLPSGAVTRSRSAEDATRNLRDSLHRDYRVIDDKIDNRMHGIRTAARKLGGTARVPATDKLTKEDVEEQRLDELSKNTLKNYAKKASSTLFGLGAASALDRRDADALSKEGDKWGYTAATADKRLELFRRSRHRADRSVKDRQKAVNRVAGITRATDRLTKEEEQIGESTDHRELAIKGFVHPDHAKHCKVGTYCDFYSKRNGDKLYGKVIKNDGKEIHFDIKGAHNRFKIGGGLTEVEAPANFWNAGMSKMNPIQVSQKQPAEPGQFKATLGKTPTRLADRDSSLEGAPKAAREATNDAATSRAPKEIELTGDWQADLPDHQFDPKLDSEAEYYPLFSQFKAMGAIPSGPAMAWEETEINESTAFDKSYQKHPVFKNNFGSVTHAAVYGKGERFHSYKKGDTEHSLRILHHPENNDYSAELNSTAHGYRRAGWATGKTSHEALDAAHKKYKENMKMPEYMKEDELSEISKETVGKYIHGVSNSLYQLGQKRKEQEIQRRDMNDAHNTLSKLHGGVSMDMINNNEKDNKKMNDIENHNRRKEYNRIKGLEKAVGKLTGTAKIPAGEKQHPIEMMKRISEAEDKK